MFLILLLMSRPAPPTAAKPLPVGAHNCYAAGRADNPRLTEALALGVDNVEIDVGWDARGKRLIVGHDAAPRPGTAYPEFAAMLEPALRSHWEDRPGSGPTVLTVDWKTADPEAVAVF